MRIAVASSGLGHITRGVETWAADLAQALDTREIDVRLYQGGGTPPRYGEVLRNLPRESDANARWRRRLPHALAWRLGFGAPYDVEQSTFAWSLQRALRRDAIDIVHVQDPLVASRMDQLRRAGFLRTRAILAHGTEEPARWLARLRYVQHLAPAHLGACRDAGYHRPTWTVIGNFVDGDRFHPGAAPGLRHELGIAPDAHVVLAVAAIKRSHKRIDWLIDAVATYRARHPDQPATLVVAGAREDDTDELVALAHERLGDAARMLVRFPRERMPELYRIADVFVMASLFEMMPIALLEAGASGLPSLVNDDPTLRWMTGDGGLPIDMGDTTAFGDALHRLLGDPAERRRRSAAARQHAVEEFGTDVIVGRIVDYYRTVLADRP